MVRDMTTGKPLKLIFEFCIPLFIGDIIQQLYSVADSMVVGRAIGVEALAAVGSTGSLSFLVLGFILGICSGFCIPISNSFGAGDYKRMRHYVFNMIYLSAVISVLVGTLTAIFAGNILQFLKTPSDIYEMARIYISIIFAGIPAKMFYNILACLLRSLGDSKTPLYFLIIAAVVNVALDILFVVVFHFGVAGAAIATVIAQLLSGFLCLIYTIKKFHILKPDKKEVKFDLSAAKKLLGTGVPMALQFSITGIGSITLQSAVNELGMTAVAAMTAAQKVSGIMQAPMNAIGNTMATYCSQNLGARKIERIREGISKSFLTISCYCVFSIVVLWFAGSSISLLFLDESTPELLSNIQLFLRINVLAYISLAIIYVYRNAIQGMGYSMIAMLAGVCEMFARIAVATIFIPKYGFTAACFAHPAAWVAADILLLIVYFTAITKLKKKDLSGIKE